jgi:hypothetical protein
MVVQELDGFSFATALVLNMSDYTIGLDPDASKICILYFLVENIPTSNYQGVFQVPQTFFQGKFSKLMASLEYARACLDDLLCISKNSLEDHLEKLEEVLRQLCNVGLKVNAEKLIFCALEIEYLGHILTSGGIKSQSNEVQAIIAIEPHTGLRQLCHFLGMVQYYHDLCLWARQRKMLAPLTSLVGECGQTKTTKAKGAKKVPWHWDDVHQRAFDHAKATITNDVALAYPDYSKVFEIYTDACSK